MTVRQEAYTLIFSYFFVTSDMHRPLLGQGAKSIWLNWPVINEKFA